MELITITTAILKALEGIDEIKNIESDKDSIFFDADGKVYLITTKEQVPVQLYVRKFNPQPKPEGKKK